MNDEIPENYPRCRFCGQPMGDGSLILEERQSHPAYGLLTVCDACHELIDALIEDALPELLRNVLDRSEEPLRERMSIFDYKSWEKYIKKNP